MALIDTKDLAKSYGPLEVFKSISVSVPGDARIAIVGTNGVGKTTLLRILIGEDEPSDGWIKRARNLSIGYMPQVVEKPKANTLWESCLSSISDLLEIESKLKELEAEMAKEDAADDVLIRYGKIQEVFEMRGGYTYEARIKQVLTGLGFVPSDYHRPMEQLSGGERTRARLARLLLLEPDLLVLDEPTNHLDIAAVEWLEGYLSQWEGAILMVSHDRYFLDKTVDHVWEMSPAGIEFYRGNYSAYLHQRQERWELRKKIFVAEKERLLRELDYVKKNIAGQRTQQAKGKLKRLSREVQAIKSLGVDVVKSQNWARVSAQAELTEHTLSVAEVERLIRGLKEPSSHLPQFNMHLRAQSRSGDLVLRTKKLLIGYQDDNEVLFEAPDLLIKRGECVALIGPNGAGKTTFLKTLLGELPPLDGEVILGAGLNIGYFAQAHEDLSPELTLVDEIWKVAPNMLLPDVRSYLARFLFRKDDAFKKVAVLSGGERGRLALAKLALENANLLLLDEPTNHLDIPSQEILQDVLAVYPGTMLLVSHDRYLIDALATQIWEISPEKRKLRVYQGTYSQYREYLGKTADVEKGIRTSKKKNQKPQRQTGRKNNRKLLARLNEIEESITALEDKLNGVSKQLENPSDNHLEVEKLGAEYVAIEKEINNLMQEWEALHSEIA